MMRSRTATATVLFLLFALLLGGQETERLDLDDILFLKKMGKSEAEILAEVERRGVSFKLDDANRLQLGKAGFSQSFELGLAKHLFLRDVLAWKQEGVPEETILIRVREAGVAFSLSTDELLRLRKAGLSDAVIRALQGGLGREALPGFRLFEHPGRLFLLQVPKEWRTIRDVEESGITYGFTPDADAKKTDQTRYGAAASAFGAGPGSPYTYLPFETVNERFCRSIVVDQKEADRTKPEAERAGMTWSGAEPDTLGGASALRNTFLQSVRGTPVKVWLYHAHSEGTAFFVAVAAPTERFDQEAALFKRILATVALLPAETVRRPTTTLRPQEVVERYKASVVKVHTYFRTDQGEEEYTGTGWFVRQDGYLFTNWHVVTVKGRYADRIEVEWDVTLRRPKIQAKLIGAAQSEYPTVDVALLKVPGTGYRPFPVARTTPQGRLVQEQDRVLVLGFPGITEQDYQDRPLTLTTTEGTISKFVQRLDGNTDVLFYTAPSNQGNSGGPVFDLDAGAVVALHTLGTSMPAMNSKLKVRALGYSRGVPIDAALENFPEVLSYPEDVEKTFTADDYAALGAQYLQRGQVEPALRQLRAALRKKDDHVLALTHLARALQQSGRAKEALEAAEQAVGFDENHVGARVTLAWILSQGNQSAEALPHLDRALETEPRNWEALLLRAEIRRASGDTAGALADARAAAKIYEGLRPEPHRSLGETCYAMGQHEKGLKAFEEALRIFPDDGQAIVGRIRYWILKDEHARAEHEFAEAARKRPYDPDLATTAATYLFGRAREREEAKGETAAKELYSKAYVFFVSALRAYSARKQDLPQESALPFGISATRGPADYKTADNLYAMLSLRWIVLQQTEKLWLFEEKPEVATLYYLLADLQLRQNQNPGIVTGLLKAGIEVKPASEATEGMKTLLGQHPAKTLTIDELNTIRLSEYHPVVIGKVIRKAGFDFELDPKAVERSNDHQYVKESIYEAMKKRGGVQGLGDSRMWKHPSGLFSIQYPKKWTGIDMQQFHRLGAWWASFGAQDRKTGILVNVYFVNTTTDIETALRGVIGWFADTLRYQVEIESQEKTRVGKHSAILAIGKTLPYGGDEMRWKWLCVSTPRGVVMVNVAMMPVNWEAQGALVTAILESLKIEK